LAPDCSTRYLVEQSGARIGYTQSDEISLILYAGPESELFCGGRVQKLTSILASMCTAKFNSMAHDRLPERSNYLALFDTRVWTVESLTEASNVILWRWLDAKKNSVSMACRHYYSHKQVLNKHEGDMIRMLSDKGVDWNQYPTFFKWGTFIRRGKVSRKYTCDEIDLLPINHDARKNPDLIVERGTVETYEMPPFNRIQNREDVIFQGADPIMG